MKFKEGFFKAKEISKEHSPILITKSLELEETVDVTITQQ